MKKAGFLLLLITLLVVGCSKGGEVIEDESKPDDITGGNNTSRDASHKAKVIVHDFTGTWCGYCAEAAYEIKQLHEKYPDNFITTAVHSGSGPNNDGSFDFDGSKVFGVEAFPTLWFNNKETEASLEVLTSNAIKTKRDIGLAINYDLKNNKVKVRVRYDKVSKDNKIVVYMVEDKLYAAQANYANGNADSPAYQKGNPIPNFEHNNVLRATLTATLGNSIPNNAISNNLYTVDYTITSSEKAKFNNISNSKVIAFVVGSNGRAINAQIANANQNKDFD